MARLLVVSEEAWYDEWSVVSSYYESEFEDIIISNFNEIFPDYIIVKFKKDITSTVSNKTKKPDLALIHKEYKDWWIVEVELSGHDFNHVESQIEAFANGDYNKFETAKYIVKQDYSKLLRKDKLEEMIGRTTPKILVIVDDHEPDWESQLLRYDAKLCILQVFKNKKGGTHVYKLDGKYPLIIENSSHCKFHPSIPNLLEVLNSDWFIDKYKKMKEIEGSQNQKRKKSLKEMILNLLSIKKQVIVETKNENEVEIEYSGKISRCKIIINDKRVYLKPLGLCKFPVTNDYILETDTTFRFYLKLN